MLKNGKSGSDFKLETKVSNPNEILQKALLEKLKFNFKN